MNCQPEPWWIRPIQQSDRSILVRIEGGAPDGVISTESQATELLLYATACTRSSVDGLLTPPRSSSPAPDDQATRADRQSVGTQLRLHALPLRRTAASLTRHDRHSREEVKSPSSGTAYFLPVKDPVAQSVNDGLASKRRKISNVFDDAKKQRRKLKGRGGEAISKAMAQEAATMVSRHARPEPTKVEQPKDHPNPCTGGGSSQIAGLRRKSHSRVSSSDTVQSFESSRPPSRRDSFVPGRRSGLNRVESVVSGPNSPLIPDSDNNVQQQNTQALSRIVMAGMRMYGLQQKRKASRPSTSGNEVLDPSINAAQGDYDEYKLVYHQTFKGACFAFRDHLAVQIVSQDAMREIVDRLLLLFCTDPLTKVVVESQGDQIFGSQDERPSNAFDLPSIGASTAVAATPSSRKSKRGP